MAVYYSVTYNGFTFDHAKLDWTEQSIYASDKMTYEATAYKFTVSGTITAASIGPAQGVQIIAVNPPNKIPLINPP